MLAIAGPSPLFTRRYHKETATAVYLKTPVNNSHGGNVLMIRRNAVAAVVFGASLVVGLSQPGLAQDPVPGLPELPGAATAEPAPPAAPGVDPAAAPALPVLPAPTEPGAIPAVAPAPVAAPAGFPALPATLGGAPAPLDNSTLPGLPGTAPAAAAPTPPPLGTINAQDGADTSVGSASSASALPQLYTFLFIDDPDYGIVRQKFENSVAERLKEDEIKRLMGNRQQGQQPLGGAAILGVTPLNAGDMGISPAEMGLAAGGPVGMVNSGPATRAAAEWDFYYNQLEMYDKFVREKLVPNAENLPELQYDSTNVLQERQDLFESFQEAAITQSTADSNDNKEFYERLSKREDRRRAYLDWLALKRREVEDWSDVWARRAYGTRWADGEEVRLDDWYYGKDFNSAKPVLVEIDDREYVISRQPVRNLQEKQLNVISTNLTPYDIIDANGELKNPVMETLRGTLVIPPAPPVYTTTAAPGTIEIVGGVTTTE